MEQKSKLELYKKDSLLCLILIVFTCLIFFPFLQGHYMSDTYNIMEQGLENFSITNSFTDGRILTGVLNLIMLKLNIPIMAYVIISLLGAIIISCITVIVLKKVILHFRKAENKWLELLIIMICYFTIFNFMYLENFYFLECIVMALSVLLYTVGAKILVEKKRYYFMKSAISVTIGMLAYQGTIGFFLALVFFFSILKNRNKVIYILKDVLISGVLVVIAGAVDLISIKLLTNYFHTAQNRLSNDIFKNILYILANIKTTLINTCGIFPKNWLLMFLSVTVVLAIIAIVEKYKRQSAKEIILWFLLIVFVIASSFASSVLSTSSFPTPRMRFSLGALMGVLWLYLYITTDIFHKKNILTILTIGLIAIYGGCNLYQYITIIDQCKQMNKIEEQECQMIDQYIENYEQETGVQVTKLARVLTFEHKENLYLPEHPNVTVCNATKCWWSAKGVIYFYTNRRLEYVDVTKEGIQMLEESGKEWQCIDDTLYIFIYQR